VRTTDLEAAAASTVEEAALACGNLDELMGCLAPCFARVEPRRQARKYVTGLMGDLPRKNCWTLAEQAGDATPDKMQRLLERAAWDTSRAMHEIRAFAVTRLGDPADAVLVLDESGQEKTGEHTAGVKRQYMGCAGRVANGINVVFASYAAAAGHAVIGARLYVPRDWADDRQRRQAAGIPDDLEFATKPQLAAEIVKQVLAEGRCPPWVTGDEVYGRDAKLRTFCEDQHTGYVLKIPCSFRVTLPAGQKIRADHAARLAPAKAWQTASAGHGSKGERDYSWAWLATSSPRRHLLIRRNLRDPADLAYFYCHVPAGRACSLTTLIRVAGRRWPVEEDFRFGKSDFGLADSQVRRYTAVTRHLALAMAALAVCATTAALARPRTSTLARAPTSPDELPPQDPGLIPLTVTEIKRIFNLVTRTWQTIRHYLHWSWWRRRHQAIARWFHQ
jgi:SRSO17 transposase